ncbi:ABC transporter ATP-binding protein [Eleftheria terrae]|uniref:ABC transporter ATP-binding protein n=1 Tax=Eleftheria terrae TaxID=1597781 RepID=UPI00263B3115|nr:dipeptide ABC transporter ATP-binding protein [Eleftheria terrae]WKB53224.1 dipeptide ABC transporter ATP-binding protein [Eleftheria terrae]
MLNITDLTVELDAEQGLVRAVDGLRLSLSRGETFALVGESGCGKSMTALALMRLLPDNGRVAAGRLELGGEELFGLPESRMRAVRGGRIAMIFQEPSTSLNPVMRIGDQIIESIETHTSLRGAAARQKAIDWLKRVGLPEPERRIDEYPFRLSGGQKQRVMIAIALAGEPDFIVADEPTTALDVTIQAQILELLKQLQRERSLGLLLITHDLGVVSGMAHRVALMYAGQVVEVAPAAEFFAAPKHPYARLLLSALPDAAKRGQPLAAIRGTVPPLWMEFQGCRFEPRCHRAMPTCRTVQPPMEQPSAGHAVRCLLYSPGLASEAPGGLPAVAASQPLSAVPLAVPVAAAAAEADPARSGAPREPGAPLLQIEHLSVLFPIRRGLLQRVQGHMAAVQDLSLDIRQGETVALVGESGCGKTTTGKAVVQLLRGKAEIQGRALLHGQDLFTLDGAALRAARRQVQIIFQDPFASLNPRMRVFEILEEGLLSLRPEWDAAARRAQVEKLVNQVGLRPDALERYPHEFSGGQRQRLAIARALAVEPQLIVCDEPTSALDVSVQAQILNLLRELQQALGVSYLFITHNIGAVEYVAHRVAVMQAGRIVESGSADEVLDRPQHPYTRTLLAAVPRVQGQEPAVRKAVA